MPLFIKEDQFAYSNFILYGDWKEGGVTLKINRYQCKPGQKYETLPF